MALSRFLFVVLLFFFSRILVGGENVWTTNGPPGAVTALIEASGLTFLAAVSRDGDAEAYRRLDLGESWTLEAIAQRATVTAFAAEASPASLVFGTTVRAQYLGEGGEIYRSVDGGSTWSLLASVSARIRSIVLDPIDPQTLYAASDYCRCTGVPCFVHFRCTLTVLRSRDAGVTWSYFDTTLSGFNVASIVIDPLVPSRLFAASEGGVAVSSDAGEHWDVASSAPSDCPVVTALAIRPDTGVLFAGAAQIYSGRLLCGRIYRSPDGGRTWSGTEFPPHYVTSIVFDPTRPDIIYAGAQHGGGFFFPRGGVFRSSDGGDTWTELGSGLPYAGVSKLVIDSTGRRLHAATSEGVYDFELTPDFRLPIVEPRFRGTRILPSRP